METTGKKSFGEWFKALDKKKILSIAANVLIWAFVVFSLIITIFVFSAQNSEDGVPSIFGKSLVTISSDSMTPTYEVGDLVLMTKLSDEEKAALKPGDIITFHAPIDINKDGLIGDINTHRVSRIEGDIIFTYGDKSPEIEDNYHIRTSDIIGICTEDGKVGGIGNVITFLRSSLGFFLCIVLPLILFFLYELYNFVTLIVSEKTKKAVAGAANIDEEEIKRRAVEEYLAKQRDEEAIKKRAIEEYLAAEAAKKSAECAPEGEDVVKASEDSASVAEKTAEAVDEKNKIDN